MASMAGAANVGDFASAIGVRAEEATIIAELKAGSEDAYAWLVGEFHQPVYSVIYRILTDPADAADTTQEVFLKVFRGMKYFHGESSLKTWIYRIAIHEASNRRRWWFRHKSKETSVEPETNGEHPLTAAENTAFVDKRKSPFENAAERELQLRVEEELRQVPEPYRTAVVLRDIEELSYEEIADITQVSLGTVKSRITRGRDALRTRLKEYVKQAGTTLGLDVEGLRFRPRGVVGSARARIEVTP
ncbi:MAG TPA: sigma-70 family RNA polymerase sigma factor [Terriglobales bacterium]|jgi:RNA polymerase sigma-70 factor (ECF subfamily)|nr:sigma-70 family RNA polymerase sigma factor [Terriglobales bacterium]